MSSHANGKMSSWLRGLETQASAKSSKPKMMRKNLLIVCCWSKSVTAGLESLEQIELLESRHLKHGSHSSKEANEIRMQLDSKQLSWAGAGQSRVLARRRCGSQTSRNGLRQLK